MRSPSDALSVARSAIQGLHREPRRAAPACEESEESEESPPHLDKAIRTVGPAAAWRLQNAAHFTADDLLHGRDAGGYCAEHRRPLSYPEQKRGACSWCVPVDPEREPEYWASHWRRFREQS